MGKYSIRHDELNETKIIALNRNLKKLKQEKINKEASQESLGQLKTELGEKANQVYNEKGVNLL